MLAIRNIFNQLQRKIALVMLAGLIWLISLPTNSVEAAGYYSVKDHKAEVVRPYYVTKERHIARTEQTTPYYATKNRRHITTTGDDYIESGKRAAEVIPKELGTGKRQKNPITMLKRAGEEVTNNPLKRSFGTQDYQRSEIEKELARNKAARGDF
jgi:hypothetical protein